MAWDDWEMIEYAQRLADGLVPTDEPHEPQLRIVPPNEASGEPIEAPEAVLQAHERPPTITYTDPATGRRVTEPLRPPEAVDPVTGMRLYLRRMRDLLRGEEP